MSSDYVIHKFKAGDLLYAHQMREIDDGIHRALQQSEQNAIAISAIKTALATAGLSVEDVQGIIQNTAIAASQLIMNSDWADGLVRLGKDAVTKITDDTITTDKVIARLVEADEGQFGSVTADSAWIKTVLRVGEDGITEIANDTITTGTVVAKLVQATSGDFTNLTANTAFVQKLLTVGEAGITQISEDTIRTATIYGEQIEVDTALVNGVLQVGESGITRIANDTITTDTVAARMATVNLLTSNVINSQSAFIQSLQSLSSTAATSTINDAYIQNAVIGKVTAAQLKAGDITISNQARIVSANGALVMNGTTMQILGKDDNDQDYVGIQIGYDTSNQPSIIVRNSEGATVMTAAGVTANAIADELIINDMVKPGTLTADRLAFNVVKQGDHIDISQIYDGQSQWGAEYTTFKQNTLSDISTLQSGLASVNSVVASVEITGPQVFSQDENGITPLLINLTTTIKNNLTVGKWYIDGTEVTALQNVNNVTSTSASAPFMFKNKRSLCIPAAYMTDKLQILVKVEATDVTKYDEMSIYKIVAGESGYTVVISSSNGTSFLYDSGVTSSTASCLVYKGANLYTPQSYTWYQINDGTTATQLGTGQSITVPLSNSVIRKSVYCEVVV